MDHSLEIELILDAGCSVALRKQYKYLLLCECVGVFPHYFKSMFHTTAWQIGNGSEVISSDYQWFWRVFSKISKKLHFSRTLWLNSVQFLCSLAKNLPQERLKILPHGSQFWLSYTFVKRNMAKSTTRQNISVFCTISRGQTFYISASWQRANLDQSSWFFLTWMHG